MAAIAIDLGNAWSRRRMVQSQVDSALSADTYSPRTAANETQIANEVAKYLNDAANKVYGQQSSPVTAAQLLDGNIANGEVQFPDPNATGDGSRMRVIAPPATVDVRVRQGDGLREQGRAGRGHRRTLRWAPAEGGRDAHVAPGRVCLRAWYGRHLVSRPSSPTASSTPTASASPSPYTPPEQENNGFTVTSVTGSPAVQGSSGNVQIVA